MEPLREIRNRLLNGWQLSKMHTFEVAARHQSFALAAEELSLSPSAVSHRINQLEEELGIQLFVRSHRKVELTHEGKRVYWALKSSLDTLNQEILDIKNQELSGTLTLYSRPSIAQCWLVPALGDFTRRYLTRIEQRINTGLVRKSKQGVYYAKFNAGALLRGDMKSRFEAYATGINWGIYSPNDCRDLEDMNPRPGGDVYLTPMNMTTKPSDGSKAGKQKDNANADETTS